jgi:excisionase family DNA binding protein
MATGALHSELPAGPADSRLNGTPDDLQELLTVEEVAALLKVSKSWIYEHTRSRGVPRSERLPHVKVGKYVRFDARLVREFIVKRTRVG